MRRPCPTRLAAGLLAAVAMLAGCATVAEPAPSSAPPPQRHAAETAPPREAEPPAAAPGDAAAEDPAPAPGPPPPRSRLDPDQDAQRGDLWERIRAGLAMPALESDRVARWEQFYARQPDYVQRMVTRGARYLFHIVEEVERRGLPSELALLPFIESAFNPQAQSSARASGMWQFMPGTGKDFELRQNVFRDDRRDVLASTRAALDYLSRLHSLFGDWPLALAAYNWGPGNVTRSIERNRRAGLRTDYASLKMPNETRDYVPKLQAVKNIVLAPARLGLALPVLENHPYFLSVTIDRDIDVALAAQLAGMALDDFLALNPQMNKPVILAAGVPQVLLPYDNANRFLRELPLVKGALASWTAWVAPRTLKPAEAAQLAGMSEALLREVNHIPPRMLVQAGSTLLVPRAAHASADVTEHLAENGSMALTPEGRAVRRVSFKVSKRGDSVAAVARRYRVTTNQVAQWNGIAPDARLRPGQAVTLMLAAAPARTVPPRLAKAPPVRKVLPKAPRTRVAQAAPR